VSTNLKSAETQLAKGEFAPVYLLVGDELYRKNKFKKLLKNTLIDPSMVDFNFDQLQANDTPGIQVVDKAGVLPMMADHRLVMVETCEKWKKKDLDAITAYVKQPNPQTCLVLDFLSADKRRKLFQAKNTQACLIEFPRPKAWELDRYVGQLAQDLGLKMDREAVALVAEMAGDDLERVHSELEKLGLFKMETKQVTAEDVALLLGRTRLVTRWELNDQLGKRDLGGALMKSRAILESGEEPISLLSTIHHFFRQMFLVKGLVQRGLRDHYKLGSVMRVPPKIAEKLMAQQRNFRIDELRLAMTHISRTDSLLKGSGMNRALILDRLLTQILVHSRT